MRTNFFNFLILSKSKFPAEKCFKILTGGIIFCTWPDAVPEDAREPESNTDLDGPEDDVMGVPAAQVDPEIKVKRQARALLLIH